MLRVGGLIALVLLIGAGALLVLKPGHKPAMAQKVHVIRQALTPKPAVLTEEADPKRKSECEASLQTWNPNSAILKSWKRYGAHVEVRVRSAYLHTDLTHKQQLDSALRCVAADGRESDQGLKQVLYRHARNDELVAMWDATSGFKMME